MRRCAPNSRVWTGHRSRCGGQRVTRAGESYGTLWRPVVGRGSVLILWMWERPARPSPRWPVRGASADGLGGELRVQFAEATGEEVSFDGVVCEQLGFVVSQPGVVGAVQAAQEFGAGRRQVVVDGELRFGGQLVEGGEPGLGSVSFADGDGAVEGHHGGWPDLGQLVVEV